LSDDQDNHPLLAKRMFGCYGLFSISGIGAALIGMRIFPFGWALCIFGAVGILSLYFGEIKNIRLRILTNAGIRTLTMELWIAVILLALSVGLPITVFAYLGSQSEIAALRGQISELSRLRWMPLTADEIVAIRHSVAETQPAQPTMNIQYLDSNAYDLAESFKQLFTDIGFKPNIQLDTRLSSVGVVKIDADDSDAELVKKIVNAVETVTKGRIKCELKTSKGQGQTRILIGQRDTH